MVLVEKSLKKRFNYDECLIKQVKNGSSDDPVLFLFYYGGLMMDVIVTHRNADFDAIASLFSARYYYKDAIPIIPRTLNSNVRSFLSIHKDYFKYEDIKSIKLLNVNRVIMVDTNNWSRIELPDSFLEEHQPEVHIWDHHMGEPYPEPSFFRYKKIGSTTTLFIEEIQENLSQITPMEATLFLAGIYEDTSHLSFPSTTPEDMRASAFLLEKGADLSVLRNFLRPAYSPAQKNILFDMLKEPSREKINGYTVSISDVELRGHVQGLSVVLNMFSEIVNVDIAFGIFYQKEQNKCIVIGRSRTDGFDISSVMKKLGGGGHPSAGSALIKGVSPYELKEWIRGLIKTGARGVVLIRDLMSYPVEYVSPETTMKEVAMLFREKGFTGVPVVQNGEVVGVISRRDFKKVRKESQLHAPVKAFMCSNTHFIGPDDSVYKAVKLMIKNDIGRLPVIEKGKLIGIVTRSDTMRYFYDLLPN